MTNSANDALKAFEAEGPTEEPNQKKDSIANPTIKLHNGDGDKTELFAVGKFLVAKRIEKATPKGKRAYMFVDIVLEKTNATATIKDEKAKGGYRDIEVKPGDIVTLFAASRLFNAASRLSPGARLYAKYDGGKMEKGKMVHQHVIKSLPGTLTPKELEYVNAANKRKEVAAVASQSKGNDEAEAADALSQLED